MTTFSAYKGIAPLYKTVARICVGHLDGAWPVYASIDFLRNTGSVYRVHPSADAVSRGKVDELIRCAIAYRDGKVEEVERWPQNTWGAEPDVVIYKIVE